MEPSKYRPFDKLIDQTYTDKSYQAQIELNLYIFSQTLNQHYTTLYKLIIELNLLNVNVSNKCGMPSK